MVHINVIIIELHNLSHRFTFECKYECASVPQIQWFKDGVELKSADYIIVSRDGHCTLTIEETFADDSANYVCKATSQAGSSETRATLKVRGMCVVI